MSTSSRAEPDSELMPSASSRAAIVPRGSDSPRTQPLCWSEVAGIAAFSMEKSKELSLALLHPLFWSKAVLKLSCSTPPIHREGALSSTEPCVRGAGRVSVKALAQAACSPSDAALVRASARHAGASMGRIKPRVAQRLTVASAARCMSLIPSTPRWGFASNLVQGSAFVSRI